MARPINYSNKSNHPKWGPIIEAEMAHDETAAYYALKQTKQRAKEEHHMVREKNRLSRLALPTADELLKR